MTLGRGVVVPAPYLGYQTTLVNPALANHGLWYQVGSGKEIALVDTLTGAVLRSMRFPSTVMSVASSPDGRIVYVTFDGTDPRTKPPAGAIVVEELDASSLKVLARQYIDGELAALGDRGAWRSLGGEQRRHAVVGVPLPLSEAFAGGEEASVPIPKRDGAHA